MTYTHSVEARALLNFFLKYRQCTVCVCFKVFILFLFRQNPLKSEITQTRAQYQIRLQGTNNVFTSRRGINITELLMWGSHAPKPTFLGSSKWFRVFFLGFEGNFRDFIRTF